MKMYNLQSLMSSLQTIQLYVKKVVCTNSVLQKTWNIMEPKGTWWWGKRKKKEMEGVVKLHFNASAFSHNFCCVFLQMYCAPLRNFAFFSYSKLKDSQGNSNALNWILSFNQFFFNHHHVLLWVCRIYSHMDYFHWVFVSFLKLESYSLASL